MMLLKASLFVPISLGLIGYLVSARPTDLKTGSGSPKTTQPHPEKTHSSVANSDGKVRVASTEHLCLCKGQIDKFRRAEILAKRYAEGKDDQDLEEPMFGFDHQDFVVSDLEFELVLRRLGCDKNTKDSSCKDQSHKDIQAEYPQADADKVDRLVACLEQLDDETIKSILIYCKNKLHRKCLQNWHDAFHAAKSAKRCPVCNHREDQSSV